MSTPSLGIEKLEDGGTRNPARLLKHLECGICFEVFDHSCDSLREPKILPCNLSTNSLLSTITLSLTHIHAHSHARTHTHTHSLTRS